MIGTQYRHTVQYYETDKMGIVHHSNYIRWMEEARVDFFTKVGWPYDRLEEIGFVSPVVSVECRYRMPSKFADVITVSVSLEEYRGARIRFAYTMVNQDGAAVCEAYSEHCVLGESGRPVRLSRAFPRFFGDLERLAAEQKD